MRFLHDRFGELATTAGAGALILVIVMTLCGCAGLATVPGAGGHGLGVRDNGSKTTVSFANAGPIYGPVTVNVHNGDATQSAEKATEAFKGQANTSVTGTGTAAATGGDQEGAAPQKTTTTTGESVTQPAAAPGEGATP